MSSTLTSQVPMLDGSNYQVWSLKMKGYLQQQDLWLIVNGEEMLPLEPEGRPDEPSLPRGTSGETDSKREHRVATHLANMSSYKTNLLNWQRKNSGYRNELREISGKESKAKGTLILRIAESLHHEVDALSAEDTWKMLAQKYSVQGPSLLYATFKQAYGFHLSGQNKPEPELNKLSALFNLLSVNGLDIPEFLKAMILLNAIPAKWSDIITPLLQGHTKENLTFTVVKDSITARAEQKPQSIL